MKICSVNGNQDSVSINLKRFSRVTVKAIECENLLQSANKIIDSLKAELAFKKDCISVLKIRINRQDTTISQLQQNNNDYVEKIAQRDAFIRKMEEMNWRYRLFRQKEIIKMYLNNTP